FEYHRASCLPLSQVQRRASSSSSTNTSCAQRMKSGRSVSQKAIALRERFLADAIEALEALPSALPTTAKSGLQDSARYEGFERIAADRPCASQLIGSKSFGLIRDRRYPRVTRDRLSEGLRTVPMLLLKNDVQNPQARQIEPAPSER